MTALESQQEEISIYQAPIVCQIPSRHLNSSNSHQFASTKKLPQIFLEQVKKQTKRLKPN